MLKEQILDFLKNDWQQRQADLIDLDAFVTKFTDHQNTRDILSRLKAQGYISVKYADDTLYFIALNQKFKDKFQ